MLNSRLTPILNRLVQSVERIKVVHLAVGELIPFREEQWREFAQGTSLASAELHLRVIRAEQQCMTCFQKYHPENLETRCPYCKSMGAKILAGEEFYLEALEEENE